MKEKSFDSALKSKLPLVAQDKKGRWFCASSAKDGARIEFFDTEDDARKAMTDYLFLKRNSN